MFKFILIGFLIVMIMFLFDLFLPKIKLKYLLYKELKETKKRQKAFKETMKRLEIK